MPDGSPAERISAERSRRVGIRVEGDELIRRRLLQLKADYTERIGVFLEALAADLNERIKQRTRPQGLDVLLQPFERLTPRYLVWKLRKGRSPTDWLFLTGGMLAGLKHRLLSPLRSAIEVEGGRAQFLALLHGEAGPRTRLPQRSFFALSDIDLQFAAQQLTAWVASRRAGQLG